jgi:spermidine synthase
VATWGAYYEGAEGVDHFLTNLYHHRVFLTKLLEERPATALEAGCGTAGMSVFLQMAGVDVTACDIDASVLDLAKRTAEAWNADVTVEERDLFALSAAPERYDVVFSQGVLEHFADEQIQAAAREALAVAPVFAFSVPGRWYGHKDFGNERLMDPADWERILAPVARAEVTPYFETRTRHTRLLKKPIMLMVVLRRPA